MPDLDLNNYQYILPESKIAKYPLGKRDQSKLLFYNKRKIEHHTFVKISNLLPEHSLLVFNETKVIQARLNFHKQTGASIEIMLLNPVAPSHDMHIAMGSTGPITWKCMIKNLRKWKKSQVLEKSIPDHDGDFVLSASLVDSENQHVQFDWENKNSTFSRILTLSGKVPLPPYLKREPVPEDKHRYQTVYSRKKGAVAAPTAGLHFTKKILNEITEKKHQIDYITLHVSAGTFQPIQKKDIKMHNMHTENIIINKTNLLNLMNYQGNVVAVGTTSMRTLESLYWYGVKLMEDSNSRFVIDKLFPYSKINKGLPSATQALKAVIDHMNRKGLEEMQGETQIFIFPGYRFKICNSLITNYHLPGSTLMLLVAAFVGDDWKLIYDAALESNYRFLSYGDASYLVP